MIASAQATPHAALRTRLKDGRDQLTRQFLARPRPRTYLRQHARLVDQLLQELSAQLLPPHMAVLAVGGYGRGELYPASDVDVLLLLAAEPGSTDQAAVEAWIQACWDAGLEIGHSVRTVGDCMDEAAQDISVETALLEARLLWGNRALHKLFSQRFQERFRGRPLRRGETAGGPRPPHPLRGQRLQA